MKSRYIRMISVFLCLALIGTMIAITRTELEAASTYPTMYCNDRAWARSDSLPMEKIYSTLYVPVTYFAQLPNVSIKKNDGQNLFVIENGDYWLTFNVKTDFAYTQDSEPMYWRSAYYHGDHYVPVRSVCSYLHLNFEELTSPVTGETAIRISDGSQTKSFEELIRDRYPGFFPEETDPPITEPPVTSDTTESPITSGTDTKIPTPELGERTIYITIEDAPGEYTEDILSVLDDFGYTATFFVIGDQMLENASLLSQIAAKGHAIGLHTMEHNATLLKDAEAILDDIEDQNLLLSYLIKQRSHIWRAPEGSAALKTMTAQINLDIRRQGYTIWDFNIDVPIKARTAKVAANSAIQGIWDNQTAILRFREAEITPEVLRLVLEFIAENDEVCDVRTISPAYYEHVTAS